MLQYPLMIFAAGFGTRMGALTKTTPKPLIKVAGRALIDHALDVARAAGARKIVVNLHYLGAQIERHLAGQDIAFSWEMPQILETGGGLRSALPLLGPGPVMLLNSDSVWVGPNPLTQLAAMWDGARMDTLLLLAPPARAHGHTGKGDFLLADDGRIARAAGRPAPIYLGAQIMSPALLDTIPDAAFSLGKAWDIAIGKGRAFGVLHQGGWCDVGTPDGIAAAQGLLNV